MLISLPFQTMTLINMIVQDIKKEENCQGKKGFKFEF